MYTVIREIILEKYNYPINSAKDCDLLSEKIFLSTNRKISSTTLRRFFGLLPSKSNLSKYNLDTLAIYCGVKDYQSFREKNQKNSKREKELESTQKLKINELTQFTLNSISKKALGSFEATIPRNEFNTNLNSFLHSDYSIYPVIAPGGYGKSIALAHWVKSLNHNKHDILFCSAPIFSQLISPSSNLKFQINLNPNEPDNYFNRLKGNKSIILVIDSIDELSSNIHKIENIFNYFIELFKISNERLEIKLIFSVRESFWNSLIKTEVIQQFEKINKKYSIYSIESGYNNFPKLSVSEIKHLFEINNKKKDKSFQYHAIPFLIQDIISIPINLYFLFELLNKDDTLNIVSSNSLNRKYLKEFVFISKFAESKEDILWKIIELIDKKNIDNSINKNELKKILPIHLKRETEYYNAYKELLINGILYEERVENTYGIYTTKVGFKHQNFFYYLTALNLIQKSGNLDERLLKNICSSNKHIEWKTNVISILYEIAYENEDYETLKDLCNLPESILSSLMVRFSVGNSFRINNSIQSDLVREYATHPVGQKFFFEQFVDTNFIINNYELRITEYLKNKQTKEARLFGNSILFLAAFLKMDSSACKKQFEIINQIEPDSTIHPWPIGRKVAYQILYCYFADKKPVQNILGFIEHYLTIAYSYPNYLDNGLVEFELPILMALVLTKDYETIIKLYEKVIHSYKIEMPQELSYSNKYNQNILPYLFSEFAKYKLGLKVSGDYIQILEKTIDNFPSTFDDFQYKIILKYFLSEYYKKGNIEKAKEYFNMAIKLSEFAQYDFYTAFLYANNPKNKKNLIEQRMVGFMK